jgi:hypothetical protein
MMESMKPEMRQGASVQRTSNIEKKQMGIELRAALEIMESLNVELGDTASVQKNYTIKKKNMGTEVLP